jgi:UDP-N-acetylmuramoylalanine--D-glutamate ligase
MNWLQDLPVLVLGLGTSGLAMARWCARHGAQVQWWDSREAPPGAEALVSEHPAACRLSSLPVPLAGEGWGEGAAEGQRDSAPTPSPQPSPASGTGGKTPRLILKSPGLSPQDPAIAPLLDDAQAAGIAVLGELDLFARALADLKAERGYAPQVLAITGTNGKTTTTAMTALLVERAGKTVALAGNIGPSLLAVLASKLDDLEAALPEVWVLELSSFQLEGGGRGLSRAEWGFEPAAAAVLNLSQDHLDWHGNMAAYAAAKARVFGSQALCVVNRDDAAVEALLPRPELHDKGPQKGKPKTAERAVLRFGLDAPQAPGDFGLVVEAGMAWLVRALPLEEGLKLKKGESPEIHLQRLMPADALRVRGRHNAANALAALALASAIGCPLAPMLHGLREYAGEPHRVQFVARVALASGEVEAFDDSKGTNVGATVAALQGLGADVAPGRLVVILGGDGKGQDFTPLALPVARHARAVATLGRDAAAIEAVLTAQASGTPWQRFATLPEAVAWCFAQAQGGDAVLLSPACASLDMFRDYAHRAEVFVQAVHALASERGAPA